MSAMKSTEQDLAQNQKSNRLPEIDGMQAENNRHQPIPQAHHYKSKDPDEQYRKQHYFYYFPDSMTFHFVDLLLTTLMPS